MPEMPEVETVRKTLNKIACNQEINEIVVNTPKIIKNLPVERFCKQIIGQKIISVTRYAKYLFINLSNNLTIVSHLRMEGKYNYGPNKEFSDKHDCIIFKFTNGHELAYNDTRKFGTMELIETAKINSLKSVVKLGPEANDQLAVYEALLKHNHKNKKIKEILLDQTIVSGIGNIYADEILFASNIHPETPINSIQLNELEQIATHSKQIIDKAIKAGGTTVKSFAVSGGVSGLFQYSLNVYGRKNQECKNCSKLIQKIKVGGRGTHFCPHCQKEVKK